MASGHGRIISYNTRIVIVQSTCSTVVTNLNDLANTCKNKNVPQRESTTDQRPTRVAITTTTAPNNGAATSIQRPKRSDRNNGPSPGRLHGNQRQATTPTNIGTTSDGYQHKCLRRATRGHFIYNTVGTKRRPRISRARRERRNVCTHQRRPIEGLAGPGPNTKGNHHKPTSNIGSEFGLRRRKGRAGSMGGRNYAVHEQNKCAQSHHRCSQHSGTQIIPQGTGRNNRYWPYQLQSHKSTAGYSCSTPHDIRSSITRRKRNQRQSLQNAMEA